MMTFQVQRGESVHDRTGERARQPKRIVESTKGPAKAREQSQPVRIAKPKGEAARIGAVRRCGGPSWTISVRRAGRGVEATALRGSLRPDHPVPGEVRPRPCAGALRSRRDHEPFGDVQRGGEEIPFGTIQDVDITSWQLF